MNTPKESRFFLILLDFPCFLIIIQLLVIAECYDKHLNSLKLKVAEYLEKTWKIKKCVLNYIK